MVKRLIDIVIAALALLLFSPALLLILLLVRWQLGSPVFFRQKRPGLYGRAFSIIKFRTMTSACGATAALLPDAERLTSFGRWLRASSLDELPELWNILVGDMSVVGPRPLLMQYLPLYNERQRRRHEVRPGITGWAQVNGRNALSWEDRFELDVWYVEHRSFWLDAKIFFMTFHKVARRDGIAETGQATMTAFTGSPPSTRRP